MGAGCGGQKYKTQHSEREKGRKQRKEEGLGEEKVTFIDLQNK